MGKLKIDDDAVEHLSALLSEGNIHSAIRIAVMGGPTGPVLGLVVDESGEDDLTVTCKALPFIIDKKLMDYCEEITIGFRGGAGGSCGGNSGGGFLINPKNSLLL